MGAITLPNARACSDITFKVRLKDNDVAVDWNSLSDIRALIYSDVQRAVAGRCTVSIDGEDSTLLVCNYSASKPQYLGINSIVIRATYQGRTKTYDKKAVNIVARTAQLGAQVTINDPTVNVQIEVTEVDTSLLDDAINAAFDAAEDAIAARDLTLATEADVEAAEALRVTAEQGRVDAEALRVSAESGRVDAEALRVSAETGRVNAEATRERNEGIRQETMQTCVRQEKERADAEELRVAAEHDRVDAESIRVGNEAGREENEEVRIGAETERIEAESARVDAEALRVSAESDRVDAETARESQAADDHSQYVDDHAVVAGYNSRLTTVEGEVSQLSAKVDVLGKDLEMARNGNLQVTQNITNGWSYIPIGPVKKGIKYTVDIKLGSNAANTFYFYLKNESSQSGPWLADGRIDPGSDSASVSFTPAQDYDAVYVNIYYSGAIGVTLTMAGPLSLKTIHDEMDGRLDPIELNFLPLAEQVGYPGWIDSSNKILSYGLSTYKVIPVVGGDNVKITGHNAGYNKSAIMILASFTYNPTLPYTPTFATGETGTRYFEDGRTYQFTLPDNARFVLVSSTNNPGNSNLPAELVISDHDYINGMAAQLATIQEIQNEDAPKYYLPLKATRRIKMAAWQQGAVAVGNKIVGFRSGADDHSTNSYAWVYTDFNFGESETMDHNLGHVNGADYAEDTDAFVTAGVGVVSTNTHTSEIIIIPGFKAKVDALSALVYNDALKITTPSLNGKFTGAVFFGETSDVLYLVTIEDPDNFTTKSGRWVYRIFLGKGQNDLTSLHPVDSFGSYNSSATDDEYNGTAYVSGVYPFSDYVELQGGKYINGRIVLPTDEVPEFDVPHQAYFAELQLFDGPVPYAKIMKRFLVPSFNATGGFQRVESEDCVIVGNTVYQQVVVHGDTTYGELFVFQLT